MDGLNENSITKLHLQATPKILLLNRHGLQQAVSREVQHLGLLLSADMSAVQALRDAGILIAIDDVGFGSSCLESLILLQPEIVKIDKRCVIGVDRDPARIEQLGRYISVARTLGCEVVAEGIETATELAIVRSLGVDYGQGYLWGKPG